MGPIRLSPKAFAGFIFFLLAFGLLFSVDQGSGPVSRAWPILVLVFVVGGTLAIYRSMWRARENPDEIRKAQARSLRRPPDKAAELAVPVITRLVALIEEPYENQTVEVGSMMQRIG
jgi:hypothetical protein